MAPSISSITTTMKLAFHNAWNKIYSILWPHSDQSTLTTTTSTPSLLTRKRYRASLWRSQSVGSLPLYSNEYVSEMQRNQTNKKPFSLGKTNLSLTFQAILGLALAFQSSSSSSTPSNGSGQYSQEGVTTVHLLHVVGVAMVIAFTASFSGVFLKQSYPKAASFFEKMGSFFLAIGFFVMTSVFIPKSFRWICWLASAFSLLVYFLAFVRS